MTLNMHPKLERLVAHQEEEGAQVAVDAQVAVERQGVFDLLKM